jgi:parallel beta-helix repeat protein
MYRKVVAIWVSLVMVFGFIVIVDTTTNFIPTVKGATHYVNETGSSGAYTSIQDAINASIDGDTVFVYNGTYYENVMVNKIINLTGEDRNNVTVNGGGVGDVINITSNWVNITGFTVTTGGFNPGEAGIELNNVHNCSVYWNNCTDVYYGISPVTSQDISIANNSVYDTQYGIQLIDSNNNIILNNTAHDNIRDGISISDSKGNMVEGNTVYFNGQQGIANGASYNTIKDNNISGTHVHGIALYPGSSDNIVKYNTINGAISSGIRVDGSSNNSIENNVAHNNLYGSWSRRHAYNNSYMNNTFYGNNDHGIYIYSSKDTVIHNNTIFGNKDEGIKGAKEGGLWDPDNIIITNNTVYDNQFGIILFDSSDSLILNNTVYENARDGVRFIDSTYITVVENTVYNNTQQGINMGSSYSTIEKNVVYGPHDYGIYFGTGSSSNTIKNNTVFGATSAGIRCDGVFNITIEENEVYNNQYGISFVDSNNITVSSNTAHDNVRDGISFVDSIETKVVANTIYDNAQHGISLNSDYNTIEHNIVYGTMVHGIVLYPGASYNTINNNTINGASSSGIRVDGASYNNIDNNVAYNNLYGTWSRRNSHNNSYMNNTFHDNSNFGIYIYSGKDSIINNNTVYENIFDGVRVAKEGGYWTPVNNTITNNKIYNNSQHGIYLSSSDLNIFSNNTVSNSTSTGIRLESSAGNNIYHNRILNNAIQAYDDSNNGNQWDDGYPSGGNYWSDYGGIDAYYGPNQDIPGSDGIGDTNYSIDADSIDNYPLMEPFKNTIILKNGWNLVSIPLIQTDQNLFKVLEFMISSYDAVQWFDNTDPTDPWKHLKIGKSFGNDLFELNETMSFWIHITQPGDTIFLYNGTQPLVNQTIQLYEGWNMVGYPSLSNHNRSEGLNNLEFGLDVDAIQWYNTPTKTWHFMDQDDVFVPGRGYWMHSKVEVGWEVPL